MSPAAPALSRTRASTRVARPGAPGASSRFRPDVQGLRAVAVVLVVLYHAKLPGVPGGFVGVDVFFVISGYLITGHLCRDLLRADFRFRDFAARRVRRILPASFVVLVFSLGVAWLVVPPLALARVSRDAVWTALYAPNLLFAREGTDYLAAPEPSLFQHYWSLGVEEQFYLLWPIVVWAVFRASRGSMRAVTWAVALIVAASLAGSVLLTPVNQPWAFFLLPTRAWELGAGGLVALLVLQHPLRLPARTRSAVAALALVGLAASAVGFTDATPFPSGWAVIPVLATAAIILCGPYEGPVAGLLQHRAALWIGGISYSVYLVHWPLLILPQLAGSWMTPLPLWASLLLGLAAFPLGWVVFRTVETPFRQPGRGWRGSPRTALAAAVLAAALVAAVAVAGMRAIPSMPLHAGEAAPAFAPTTDPVSAPVVGENLSVRLQDHQSESAVPSGRGCNLTTLSSGPTPACTYGSDDTAPSVALVGDSHAAQWAPAFEEIAASGGIRLTAHTRSGCPLYDRSLAEAFTETPECQSWRRSVLEHLAAAPPDVIVLSASVRTPAGAYRESLRHLLPQLPRQSRVVLLRDTPQFRGDPLSCLSRHLRDPGACAADPDQVLSADVGAVDAEIAAEFGADRLDFTPYLCGERCPPVQGDVLVFKDSHHLSRTFSRAMAPVVAEALAPILPARG